MNYRPTVSNLEFHLHVTRSMYFNLLCQEFNTLSLCNAFLIFSICSNTTSLCHISKMPTLCSTCSKLTVSYKGDKIINSNHGYNIQLICYLWITMFKYKKFFKYLEQISGDVTICAAGLPVPSFNWMKFTCFCFLIWRIQPWENVYNSTHVLHMIVFNIHMHWKLSYNKLSHNE